MCRLLFLPYKLDDKTVKPEISIIPLLKGGRVKHACEIAKRRLYVCGFSPFNADLPDSRDGKKLAAALMLPVGYRQIRELSRMVLDLNNTKQEE